MRTIPIAHYRKDDSDFFVNGGKLTVTESEYIVTCFFKTVARFPIAQTTVTPAPTIQLYEGITLSHGDNTIHLYLSPHLIKVLEPLIDPLS